VRWCQEYKWLKPSYWYQVVWVDEFTIYEKPEPQTFIHRKGDHLSATDFKLHPFGYGTYGKLSVCIAVNAYVGLVGFWWIHNTTGYRGRKTFWVSAGPPPHPARLPLPPHLRMQVPPHSSACPAPCRKECR
jgi:hypothetical protein